MFNFPNIIKKQWFKISFLNTISICIRIITGILTSKITAVYLGPAGVASIESFRNLFSIIERFGSLGIENGIIKYVAFANDNLKRKKQIISTSFYTLLALNFLLSAVLILLYFFNFNEYITLLKIDFYLFIFILLTLPFLVFNTVFLSVFKANHYFKTTIFLNTLGYVISFILLYYLILYYNIVGALYAITLAPIFLSISTIIIWFLNFKEEKLISYKYFSINYVKKLKSFAIMALVSGILGPIVFIEIRNQLTNEFSEVDAGFWSSLLRISGFYMMFLTTVMSLYFYPKIVKSKNLKLLKPVAKEYFLGLVPLFLLGLIFLFIIKNWFITIFLSEQFLPISNYLHWQLIGDFLKSLGLFFGYCMISNKKTSLYIIGEIISFGSYLLLAKILIPNYSIYGALYAFIISNAVYLLYILILRKKIFY